MPRNYVPVADREKPIELPADSAMSLYRDRSGKPMGGMHQEGAGYLGHVAAEARKTVEEHEASKVVEVEE